MRTGDANDAWTRWKALLWSSSTMCWPCGMIARPRPRGRHASASRFPAGCPPDGGQSRSRAIASRWFSRSPNYANWMPSAGPSHGANSFVARCLPERAFPGRDRDGRPPKPRHASTLAWNEEPTTAALGDRFAAPLVGGVCGVLDETACPWVAKGELRVHPDDGGVRCPRRGAFWMPLGPRELGPGRRAPSPGRGAGLQLGCRVTPHARPRGPVGHGRRPGGVRSGWRPRSADRRGRPGCPPVE